MLFVIEHLHSIKRSPIGAHTSKDCSLSGLSLFMSLLFMCLSNDGSHLFLWTPKIQCFRLSYCPCSIVRRRKPLGSSPTPTVISMVAFLLVFSLSSSKRSRLCLSLPLSTTQRPSCLCNSTDSFFLLLEQRSIHHERGQ